MKTEDLRDDTYFINTGTYAVYYKNGHLQADVNTPTKDWHAQTRRFDENRWQKVEISWSKDDGLELYVNNEKLAGDERGTSHAPRQPRDWNMYFGRPNNQRVGSYTNGYIDEVDVWYATRDILVIFGYLDDRKLQLFYGPLLMMRRCNTCGLTQFRPFVSLHMSNVCRICVHSHIFYRRHFIKNILFSGTSIKFLKF